MAEEAQRDDVGLPGEKVVADSCPGHGPEVSVHDLSGKLLGSHCHLSVLGLDLPEGLSPELGQLRLRLVAPANLHVGPGAEPIERLSRLGGESEVADPDQDIRHLNPGVVNVVLHLDLVPSGPQQPSHGVADAGVAKVAHVGRLVWVGGSVLDHHLGSGPRVEADHLTPAEGLLNHPGGQGSEVEAKVDVAGPADRHLTEMGERASRDPGDQLRRDLPGRTAQAGGEPERQSRGVVPRLRDRGGFHTRVRDLPDPKLSSRLRQSAGEFILKVWHRRLIVTGEAPCPYLRAGRPAWP